MSIVKNLKLSYPDFFLNIPEWEIPDQGITALMGRSGSGKSTIIKVLLGLEPCKGLSWEFKGQNLAALPVQERRLGVVFQNYELFPHMSAQENILFAAQARGISRQSTEAKLKEYVRCLDLNRIIDKKAQVLSMGERQRVALARALMGEPVFLFLDEPFSALDADVKAQARALVKKVLVDEAIPSLLVTHDPADLEALARHAFKIEGSELVSV